MLVIAPEKKNFVMHVALPILSGMLLMRTDAPESMGFRVNPRDNVCAPFSPDSGEEVDRLFKKLTAGGKVETLLHLL